VNPKWFRSDGVLLGGHGLFTWGETQRDCYLNTITIIDQLGQFVSEHLERRGTKLFGGSRSATLENHLALAQEIFPFIRGRVSAKNRLIGNFNRLPEVLRFVNSAEAREFAHLGTSCPDHFIRTKIRPLFVPWNPQPGLAGLREAIDDALAKYRKEYAAYYASFAQADSPRCG
jgi:rhamnose utilization protein RhaD (predicted bifunctional aldolase and dehydrogenase)